MNERAFRLWELGWQLHWLLVLRVRLDLGLGYWWPSDLDFRAVTP